MSTLRNALRDLPGPVFADLLESEETYCLVVDLPGVDQNTIEVSIDGPRVRIEARREKDLPREFRYLQEDRPLFLDADLLVPPDASGSGASATIDRGRLELRFPKRDRADATSVPITVRDPDEADPDERDGAAHSIEGGDDVTDASRTHADDPGHTDDTGDTDDA